MVVYYVHSNIVTCFVYYLFYITFPFFFFFYCKFMIELHPVEKKQVSTYLQTILYQISNATVQ